MDLTKPAFILGLSIVGAVFVNNFFASDRYSLRHEGVQEYSNYYVSYLTDRMTGKVKRITYCVFKDSSKKLQNELVKIVDLETGYEDRLSVVDSRNAFRDFNLNLD